MQEVPGGIQVPTVIMKQWTVSFWVILPMTMFDTGQKYVLLQNIHGEGAYVQIDETGSWLQVVCEHSGNEINADVDLNKLKRGWHNIVVTCDNAQEGNQGEIKFHFNG